TIARSKPSKQGVLWTLSVHAAAKEGALKGSEQPRSIVTYYRKKRKQDEHPPSACSAPAWRVLAIVTYNRKKTEAVAVAVGLLGGRERESSQQGVLQAPVFPL
ncbi:MAG: hypothetical protein ACT6SG_20735, partial [Hydrogenophaga sp.]|uniref:hypothetical protein n=1 Tax=Hydrogenophaga sp. TaxID=1904254 RepID=UPI004036525E